MSKLLTWAATVGLCLFALPSCSPKIVEKWNTQYVYRDVHHRDTVITKDSVYIREWVKGDTVFVEKYKDRFVYRDRWRDSIIVKRDSVAVETLKEVKVEKPPIVVAEGQDRGVSVAPSRCRWTGRLDIPETSPRMLYEIAGIDI